MSSGGLFGRHNVMIPEEMTSTCVRRTRKAFWDSFNAASSVELWSDTAFLKLVLDGHLDISMADSLWLSCMALPGMVLRRKGTEHWFLSLGQLGGACAIAWPLDVARVDGEVRLRMHCNERADLVSFLAIEAIDTWESLPVRVLSHARALLLRELRRSASSGSTAQACADAACGIWFQELGPPRPLLDEYAARAFKGLSISQLRRLCKHIGIPMVDDASVEAILRAALAFVSGAEVSDEELLLAMQKLVDDVDQDLSVFGLQDCQDAFDEHDWQEVEKFQGRKKVDNPHSVEKSLARLRNDIVAEAAKHGKPAKKARRRVGQGTILGGDRQYFVAWYDSFGAHTE